VIILKRSLQHSTHRTTSGAYSLHRQHEVVSCQPKARRNDRLRICGSQRVAATCESWRITDRQPRISTIRYRRSCADVPTDGRHTRDTETALRTWTQF